MYFYYTGAKQYLGQQGKKEYSLGGFVSQNRISNNEIGNLFSQVSLYDIEKKLRNIIGIVLKNESGVDISDLRLWFESPANAYCKFEVAAVALAKDSKNQYYMEELANNESLPYNATFHSANGQSSSVLIGDLVADGMIGLWIKRTVDKDGITALFTDSAIKTRTTSLPVQEDVMLQLSWNDDDSSSSSSV